MAADFLNRDLRGTSLFDRNDTPRGEVGACGSYETGKAKVNNDLQLDVERFGRTGVAASVQAAQEAAREHQCVMAGESWLGDR
jgi:hypothetical protein